MQDATIAFLFAETNQRAELIDAFGKLSGKGWEALLLNVRRKAKMI